MALLGFCTRYHVDQLSLLPSEEKTGKSIDDAQRMLVEFDPSKLPGKFTFLYMAIELSNMVGRWVDLRTDGSPVAGERLTGLTGQPQDRATTVFFTASHPAGSRQSQG